MPTNVIMPHMGESVVKGKIVRWLKRPGDAVQEDEPLVEVSTEKINVEIPAPGDGVLLKVLAEEGAEVKVEQAIAVIGEAGEQVEAAPLPERKPPSKPAAAPVVEAKTPSTPPKRPLTPRMPPVAPAPPAPPTRAPDGIAPTAGPVELGTLGVLASPAVRRFARQLRVDLGEVKGTGRLGRITREDVQAHADHVAPEKQAPARKAEPPEKPRERHPDVDEELVPLTAMRRAIAEHMVRSKHEAPHVTTVAEVDVTDVAALRGRKLDEYAAKGIKLTYMPFILNAVARALKEYPDLNAQWTDKGILIKYRINLGLAVAVEDGLVVPVIRDADRLTMPDLARAIQMLAEKTRQGKVSPADLAGGTFTITNPGVFGAVISTPIIHQPQAAILATGRIADVPAVVDGQIVVRKRMFMSLSYDHRIVDGATAVHFLQRVREIMEKADFGMG